MSSVNQATVEYPQATRDDTADTLHGERVADPYRYLEDPDADRTVAFVTAQNAVSQPYLDALPTAGYFRRLLTHLLDRPHAGAPWERGGRYFRLQKPAGANQHRLLAGNTLPELISTPRVLLDPNELADDGSVSIADVGISPDGRFAAVALSESGSDWRRIVVLDADNGARVDVELQWTKWVGPTWLPDSSGLVYWRYPEPQTDGHGEFVVEMPPGALTLHRLGTDQDQDISIWSAAKDLPETAAARADGPEWLVQPQFSDDGRYLMLTAGPGTDSRTLVQIVPVSDDPAAPFGAVRTVIGELTDTYWPVEIVGEQLFLTTKAGAERGRLVRLNLADSDSNTDGTAAHTDGTDGAAGPQLVEVIGEHPEDVLTEVAACAAGWLAVYSHDTAHRIDLVPRLDSAAGSDGAARVDGTAGSDGTAGVDSTGALDGGGQAPQPIPAPNFSSLSGLHSRLSSDEVFLEWSSFTDPGSCYRVAADAPEKPEPLPDNDSGREGQARGTTAQGGSVRSGSVPAVDVVIERRTGVSADGTPVPMTVVRRSGLPDGPRPTLLYGYGGFDIAVVPEYRAMFDAWVRAGGVLVVANLRGGGEFGQSWHEAGMLEHKQRVFDDLYGCAEALIADGTTTAAQLAVHGRSNGGLLAGAALVQRPDLWAAALPTVGVLDMLRFHLFTIGRAWTTEYGNPDDPQQFPALRAYSPLHNTVEGASYPATLITTGDHDDRVVPAHSLKFGAQLQYSQGGDAPVLLRIDTKAGHGAGKSMQALAAEYADQLAFAAAHTGLNPESSDQPG
ncbi:prolyl oligopeptidase family serine peptidase [Nakamurella aerolata]|uniref:prolyl oligopeptidase n=1 Tax=Nakamurella aerolata TaxID=1656892 RepID=A0A849A5S7_9ACTN|nr:S9 family peptidase [Nakamurella aerolata]